MKPYRELDPQKVIATIAALHSRITERLPHVVGLGKVCGELLLMAGESSTRARRIAAANLPLRAVTFAVLVAGAAGLVWIALLVATLPATADNVFSVLQGVEAAANLLVLLIASAFFLLRIEERLKRRDALAALNEIRSIVHVIDMHQLTKDPGAMSLGATASSPARRLTRVDTSRYLDYCSEMLSLSAKVAVLLAQGFPDAEIIEAVSDIERLVTGLSQKIWQKIMIVLAEVPDADPTPAVAPAR